jgi:hypothetical protein
MLTPPDGSHHAWPAAPWELAIAQRPAIMPVVGIMPQVESLLAG